MAEIKTENPARKSAPRKAWYVLRAISGKEAKVKELLDGAIKNSDLGNHVFQVLIPTEKVLTVKNGKKVVKERNLYSGYVFVECELIGEVAHELANTTNVIDFLKGRGKDAKPEPLRESEVMRMLGTADEINENLDEGVNDYMVGETSAHSPVSTARLPKSSPIRKSSRLWSASSDARLPWSWKTLRSKGNNFPGYAVNRTDTSQIPLRGRF